MGIPNIECEIHGDVVSAICCSHIIENVTLDSPEKCINEFNLGHDNDTEVHKKIIRDMNIDASMLVCHKCFFEKYKDEYIQYKHECFQLIIDGESPSSRARQIEWALEKNDRDALPYLKDALKDDSTFLEIDFLDMYDSPTKISELSIHAISKLCTSSDTDYIHYNEPQKLDKRLRCI